MALLLFERPERELTPDRPDFFDFCLLRLIELELLRSLRLSKSKFLSSYSPISPAVGMAIILASDCYEFSILSRLRWLVSLSILPSFIILKLRFLREERCDLSLDLERDLDLEL